MKKYILLIFVAFFFVCGSVNASTTARALILDQGANVRTGPSTKYSRIKSLTLYTYYNLVEDKTYPDENNHNGCSTDWYQLYHNGVATGYVCGEHVEVVRSYSTDDVEPTNECETAMSELGFPSSYWGGLCRIKEAHPNWNFVVQNVGVDWSDAIKGESSCGWNLIYGSEANKGFIDTTCKAYDSGYVGILPSGVAYYMDPRNFLSERYVFQFLHLGYDEKFNDLYLNGITSIIGGAEFYKYHININNNLAEMINNAGSELNVSPIFISARILNELGQHTTLYNLYSGVYTGMDNAYFGYYNFYNFGVSDSCVQEHGTTYCGLTYAKKKEWNTPEVAIKGGVSQLSHYYLQRNQYTSYLQKFNVLGSSAYPRYSHQYMTSIVAPMSEASTTYLTFSRLNILNEDLIFYIPVYDNMSATIDNSGNGAVEEENEETNPLTIPIPTIVTSSGYKYTKDFISGIELGTTVESLKSSLEAVGGNSTVTIFDTKGTTVYEGKLGTGFKVSISNQSSNEVLEVVIKGDTSGDGEINALDLLQVQKSILGTYTLSNASKVAGDTSGDNEINALDLLQVQKNILGTYKIEQ